MDDGQDSQCERCGWQQPLTFLMEASYRDRGRVYMFRLCGECAAQLQDHVNQLLVAAEQRTLGRLAVEIIDISGHG